MSGNQTKHEELGPSEEAKAEFEKELAKMVTDTSAESRKVDKKTALALWDSAALAPSLRKKRVGDDMDQGSPSAGNEVMSFTLVSKRGNKQQVSDLSSCGMSSAYLGFIAGAAVGDSVFVCSSRSHEDGSAKRQGRTARTKATRAEL